MGLTIVFRNLLPVLLSLNLTPRLDPDHPVKLKSFLPPNITSLSITTVDMDIVHDCYRYTMNTVEHRPTALATISAIVQTLVVRNIDVSLVMEYGSHVHDDLQGTHEMPKAFRKAFRHVFQTLAQAGIRLKV
jgi:hypothetical protein